jgi:hypothetical protein
MSNWKVIAGATTFASVISLLAGLIRGNPFGIIILRLLISAILFGGLALAAILVLKRFVPELGQVVSPEAAKRKPGVDILLPEENPHEAAGVPSGAEAGDMIETEQPGWAEGGAGPPDLPEDGTLLPDGEPAGETDSAWTAARPGVAEDGAESEDAGGLEARPADGIPVEEGVFSADGAEGEARGGEVADGEVPGDAGGPLEIASELEAFSPASAGVDILPDIDRLGSGFVPQGVKPVTHKVSQAVRDQDPESLAKAVRTFLKKDQKG